jgi:hypothetical protein
MTSTLAHESPKVIKRRGFFGMALAAIAASLAARPAKADPSSCDKVPFDISEAELTAKLRALKMPGDVQYERHPNGTVTLAFNFWTPDDAMKIAAKVARKDQP